MAVRACAAKTRAGSPCKRAALPNGRCRYHGGLSPAGPASSSWKHGRYSKYLPMGLQARTMEFLRDPDALSLMPNVAVLDARLSTLMEALDKGGAITEWDAIIEARDAFRRAVTEGDAESQGRTLDALLRAIEQAQNIRATFREIMGVTGERRKLVRTEALRIQAERDSITYDRAMGLVTALVSIFARHERDKAILAAVMRDVQALTVDHRRLPPGDGEDDA